MAERWASHEQNIEKSQREEVTCAEPSKVHTTPATRAFSPFTVIQHWPKVTITIRTISGVILWLHERVLLISCFILLLQEGEQWFSLHVSPVQFKLRSTCLGKPLFAPHGLSKYSPINGCKSDHMVFISRLLKEGCPALPLSPALSLGRSMACCHWLCASRQ